jgi:hypothetical protein
MKNPVAKNIRKANKPAVHRDRKKAAKRGETKHPFIKKITWHPAG